MYFYPSTSEPVQVIIGASTAQDLTVDLGPPLRVHYKEDDRMTIHARGSQPEADADSDCKTQMQNPARRKTENALQTSITTSNMV